nr:hypothetical protein [Tanacetum cinerariifolium]
APGGDLAHLRLDDRTIAMALAHRCQPSRLGALRRRAAKREQQHRQHREGAQEHHQERHQVHCGKQPPIVRTARRSGRRGSFLGAL